MTVLYLFCGQNTASHLCPIAQGKYRDVIIRLKDFSTFRITRHNDTYINSLLSESGKYRIRSASNGTVLALEDNPNLQQETAFVI